MILIALKCPGWVVMHLSRRQKRTRLASRLDKPHVSSPEIGKNPPERSNTLLAAESSTPVEATVPSRQAREKNQNPTLPNSDPECTLALFTARIETVIKLIGIFASKKTSIEERLSKAAHGSPSFSELNCQSQTYQQIIDLAEVYCNEVLVEREALRDRVNHLGEQINLAMILQ